MTYDNWTQERIDQHRAKNRAAYHQLTPEQKQARNKKRNERRRRGRSESEKEYNRKYGLFYSAKRRQLGKILRSQYIKEIGGTCQKCGTCYPDCVFDFHHRNSQEKEDSLSSLFKTSGGKMTEKLRLELTKCDLLCANCHRLLHHEISPADG